MCKTITQTYARFIGGLWRNVMGTNNNCPQLHCEVISNNR